MRLGEICLEFDVAFEFATRKGRPVHAFQSPVPADIGVGIQEFDALGKNVAHQGFEVFAVAKNLFSGRHRGLEVDGQGDRFFFGGFGLGLFSVLDRLLHLRDLAGHGDGQIIVGFGFPRIGLFIVNGIGKTTRFDERGRDESGIRRFEVLVRFADRVEGRFGLIEIARDQTGFILCGAAETTQVLYFVIVPMERAVSSSPRASLALLALLVFALLGLLAACNPPAESRSENREGKKLRVGVVFDRGGLGDKSFNDSAWRGLQRAQEELGIEAHKVESKEEKDYEANLIAMADEGMDLVIAVGLNQEKALERVAPDYPETTFAIVDGSVDAPNVRSLLFNEEEGSFLVGYIAGKVTQTKKVGFIGGMELDLIKKFQYGYEAGVIYADRSVQILDPIYTGGWDDIDKAKVAANTLFDAGADIVYHAAGRGGLGVIRAAKERNLYAIGVDSNQDAEAKGNVLTSMIKRVDEAVFATIKDLQDGTFEPGVKRYDLSQGGVGTTDFEFTKDKIGPQVMSDLEKIKQQIISGEIKVPATAEEFKQFAAQR